MIRVFFFLLIGIFTFLSTADAQKEESSGWLAEEFPYRAQIYKTPTSRWHADVGYILLFPGGMDTKKLQARVFSVRGNEVGSQILWASDCSPVKLLFDCSSKLVAYTVYFGEKTETAPKNEPSPDDSTSRSTAWTPKAGLILETRELVKNNSLDSLQQIKRLWNSSQVHFGKTPVSQIFHGTHIHGQPLNFISYYHGYFPAIDEGEYCFATVSDDASFIVIDGKEIAGWPGWHDIQAGRFGQHNGKIHLTKGVHEIEYWHAQALGPTIAVAAWKTPGKDRFQLMPPAAFAPIAQFGTIKYEALKSEDAENIPAFFEWEVVQHSKVDDLAIVDAMLRVPEPQKEYQYLWTFDDGTTASGWQVSHLFVRPAVRSVRLEVLQNDKKVAFLQRKVDIHPRWDQLAEWQDAIYKKQWGEIMARDFSRAPVEDVAYLLRFAIRIQEAAWLDKLAPICFSDKALPFSSEHASIFYDWGILCLDPAFHQMEIAEKAFQTALKFPLAPEINQKTRLYLARMRIENQGRIKEGIELLESLDSKRLTPEDLKAWKLLQAEIHLIQGNVAKAREYLLTIGPEPVRNNMQSVKRRARLQQAELQIKQKQFQDAETTLKNIEKEDFWELMSPETGILTLRICLGRQEYPAALSLCQRLLHLASIERHKATILFHLVEIQKAMGNSQDAEKAFKALITDYPYSEASAIAKEKWGH